MKQKLEKSYKTTKKIKSAKTKKNKSKVERDFKKMRRQEKDSPSLVELFIDE